MGVDYTKVAPRDLLEAVTTGNTSGSVGQLLNPPSVAPLLEKLGVPNNEATRRFTDPLQAALDGQTRKVKPIADVQPLPGGASFVNLNRRPFTMTCQQWLESTSTSTPKFLYCRVNPRSVQWNFQMRAADQKTLAGTVQHVWRNNLGVRRGTFFAEPVLTLTFQSGNIMPVYVGDKPQGYMQNNPWSSTAALFQKPRPKKAQTGPTIPSGLDNFYHFADLIGAPRILDTQSQDKRLNVVYLMYTSAVYPSIVLAGMFGPDGFSFNDEAESPLKIEWSASFTVYDSYPRFDNAGALRASWAQQRPAVSKDDGSDPTTTPATAPDTTATATAYGSAGPRPFTL